jgi:hypothetical protein
LLLRDSACSAEHGCGCDGIEIIDAIGILLAILGNINILSLVTKGVDVVVCLVSGENSNSVVLDREPISTRGSPGASYSVIFDVSCCNTHRSSWAGTCDHGEVSCGETLSANVGGNNANSVSPARSKVSVHICVCVKASRSRGLNHAELIRVAGGHDVS